VLLFGIWVVLKRGQVVELLVVADCTLLAGVRRLPTEVAVSIPVAFHQVLGVELACLHFS
jgi:hypothetical protein